MSSSGEQVLSLCFRQGLLGDFPFSPAIWAPQHGLSLCCSLVPSLMLAAIVLWHHTGPWTLWHNHMESVTSLTHKRILRWQEQMILMGSQLYWLKRLGFAINHQREGHAAQKKGRGGGEAVVLAINRYMNLLKGVPLEKLFDYNLSSSDT